LHRSYSLSGKHFGSTWTVCDINDRNDRDTVNKLAFEFATTEDIQRRDELQLFLLECFHGYLLKYLNMIIFGQLPAAGSPQGKDAYTFLRLLIGSDKDKTIKTMRDACKEIHLAFKDQVTTDEVYDELVFLFLKVCAHYDPLYPKKTEKICRLFEAKQAETVVSKADVMDAVGFDPTGCIRVLVKRKHLASVQGPKKSTLGYKRGEIWPAPEKLFEITSMGFVGFAQYFFRLYLKNYVEDCRKTIESSGNILQLDYMPTSKAGSGGDDGVNWSDRALPHADGVWVDTNGTRWAADIELMNKWRSMDVSRMNESWIRQTDDFLFEELTTKDRLLLYLIYVRDLTFDEIGKTLQTNSKLAEERHQYLLTYLEDRANGDMSDLVLPALSTPDN